MRAPPATSPRRAAPTSTSSLVARFSRRGTGVKSSSYAPRKKELRSTRLGPPRREERQETREEETAEGPDRDTGRQERRAPGDAQSGQRTPKHRGLHDDGEQRGGGVEPREQSKQLLRARCGLRRPRLEYPIQHAFRHRREDDQKYQSPKIGGRLKGPSRRKDRSGSTSPGSRPARIGAAGRTPSTSPADRKWRAARSGSIAVSGRVAPTRTGRMPPMRPPTEAPAVMRPMVPRAARGSNRSVTIAQNPETSRAPSALKWR